MNKDEMYARIYFHIPEYSVENPLSILTDTSFGIGRGLRSDLCCETARLMK